MRLFVAHNQYRYAGGEDGMVQAEISLLQSNGHEVDVLEEDNDSVVRWTDAAATALRCVYSIAAARNMRRRLERFKPHPVHSHTFFPRLSPSIHYVCRVTRIPVVQTLHNYRLLCLVSTLLKNGKICEECMGKAISWPAVQHGCAGLACADAPITSETSANFDHWCCLRFLQMCSRGPHFTTH